MENVLGIDTIEELDIITNFLDFQHHGRSGLSIEYGVNALAKESLIRYKTTKIIPQYIKIWNHGYVAITNDSIMYIMKTMYDPSNRNACQMNIADSLNVIIRPYINHKLCIHIACKDSESHELHVFIQFHHMDEYASWLRHLTNLSMPITNQAAAAALSSSSMQNQSVVVPSKSSFTGSLQSYFASSKNRSASPENQNFEQNNHLLHPQPDELSELYGI